MEVAANALLVSAEVAVTDRLVSAGIAAPNRLVSTDGCDRQAGVLK